MLSVLVKGTRNQAERAMAAAGIPFQTIRETGPRYAETVGHVPDEYLERVREAFHKDDAARDAIRLPVGAILLWSYGVETLEDVIRALAKGTTSANALTDRELAYWKARITNAQN